MSKDLRIEFKFRNAALLSKLQEVFGQDASIKVMAEGAGVPYADLCYLLALIKSPFMLPGSKRGTEVEGIIYTKTAMALANFFYVDPAELFPVSLYSIKFPKKYYKDFESVQLLSFQEAAEQKLLPPVESYEENYEALGLKERMGQLLETLTAREAKIIRMRFGLDDEGVEHTLAEVGKVFGGLSTERVRQIEKKALRKLRHPARSQKIKVFYTGEEPPPPEPVVFTPEIIQNRVQGRVKPEVREAVQARVKEFLPMERWADPREDPDMYPDPLTEKHRLVLVAKLTRLKKIKEYDQPNEKWVHAWDPVLKEFRMLPYSLVVEDNHRGTTNGQDSTMIVQ